MSKDRLLSGANFPLAPELLKAIGVDRASRIVIDIDARGLVTVTVTKMVKESYELVDIVYQVLENLVPIREENRRSISENAIPVIETERSDEPNLGRT